MALDMISIGGFLLIGLVAGWLGAVIARGGGFGLIGNIVVGVIGSFVGAWIFSFLGFGTYGTLRTFIAAVIGAAIFLSVLRIIKKA